MKQDVQIVILTGMEDPPRAVAGFAFAVASLALYDRVHVWLSMRGAVWASKTQGHQRDVSHFESIKTYMGMLFDRGAQVSICSNCVKERCLLQGIEGTRDEIHAEIELVGMSTIASNSATMTTVVF